LGELAYRGPRLVAQAIEYTGHRKATGLGYVVKTLGRWYLAGMDGADIALEVEGAKPRVKRPVGSPPPMNYNPPVPIAPERPPTPEEIAETLDTIRRDGPPTVRRLNLAYLKRWVMMGWISQEVLDEFADAPAAAKKDRLRVPLQSPPQPAGVHRPEPVPSDNQHTVKECSRQGSGESGSDGLMACFLCTLRLIFRPCQERSVAVLILHCPP